MKQLFTLLFIAFTIAATAQKKDTAKLDTAFIFSVQDIETIKGILMESKVIVSGQGLSGKELQQLFAWIDSKGKVFRKEQPKK
jgi:hypothetical protein